MCADDQVTKVSRVDSFIETRAFPQRKLERRLQKTVNETGTVYGVRLHEITRFSHDRVE